MCHFSPGIPMNAARKELPDGTAGNPYKLHIFLLIIQTRPPNHCVGGFAADASYLESKVIYPNHPVWVLHFIVFNLDVLD